MRLCLWRLCADSVTSRAGPALHAAARRSIQLPRLRQELGRRVRDDLSLAVAERDPVEPKLVQPLAAPAAGRGRDADRLEVTGAASVNDRPRDRRALGADP